MTKPIRDFKYSIEGGHPIETMTFGEAKSFSKFLLSINNINLKTSYLINEIIELKEDRLVKYFGSDGLLYKIKNICDILKQTDDAAIQYLKIKCKSLKTFYKKYLFTDFLIYIDSYIIPEESLELLFESAETFSKEISVSKFSLITENSTKINELKSFINELENLERKLKKLTAELNKISDASYNMRYNLQSSDAEQYFQSI